MFWPKNVILGFWVRTSFVFGRTYRARKGQFGHTFSVGQWWNVLFVWKSFSCFSSKCFPKIISRSMDITVCVPWRGPQYTSAYLSTHFTNNDIAICKRNSVCLHLNLRVPEFIWNFGMHSKFFFDERTQKRFWQFFCSLSLPMRPKENWYVVIDTYCVGFLLKMQDLLFRDIYWYFA